MPRRKKRRRKKDNRIPLLTVLPTANAALIDPLMHAKPSIEAGDLFGAFQRFADRLSENFIGVWVTQPEQGFIGLHRPMMTYSTIIFGAIASKLATHFGVNRNLKKLPFVGKYLKL